MPGKEATTLASDSASRRRTARFVARFWDSVADSYDAHLPGSDLFSDHLQVVLDAVDPGPAEVGLDLGAGTGFLTVPLAERMGRVYAVDLSQGMIDRLGSKLAERRLRVWACRADLMKCRPPEPVDVVVSNYALHHLSHRRKQELLRRCYTWMQPGGRIAVSDLTVPLTLARGQNQLLLRRLRRLLRKGWRAAPRLFGHAFRWAIGKGEYPATAGFWELAMRDAGFEGVQSRAVGGGSGVIWGRKPASATPGGS
jgi:ubiquinone/menaquinone biosynthesis C-methylase UbiE